MIKLSSLYLLAIAILFTIACSPSKDDDEHKKKERSLLGVWTNFAAGGAWTKVMFDSEKEGQLEAFNSQGNLTFGANFRYTYNPSNGFFDVIWQHVRENQFGHFYAHSGTKFLGIINQVEDDHFYLTWGNSLEIRPDEQSISGLRYSKEGADDNQKEGPFIKSIMPRNAYVNQTYEYNIIAVDKSGGDLSYRFEILESGGVLEFYLDGHTFKFNPSAKSKGKDAKVKIIVCNKHGGCSSQESVIHILGEGEYQDYKNDDHDNYDGDHDGDYDEGDRRVSTDMSNKYHGGKILEGNFVFDFIDDQYVIKPESDNSKISWGIPSSNFYFITKLKAANKDIYIDFHLKEGGFYRAVVNRTSVTLEEGYGKDINTDIVEMEYPPVDKDNKFVHYHAVQDRWFSFQLIVIDNKFTIIIDKHKAIEGLVHHGLEVVGISLSDCCESDDSTLISEVEINNTDSGYFVNSGLKLDVNDEKFPGYYLEEDFGSGEVLYYHDVSNDPWKVELIGDNYVMVPPIAGPEDMTWKIDENKNYTVEITFQIPSNFTSANGDHFNINFHNDGKPSTTESDGWTDDQYALTINEDGIHLGGHYPDIHVDSPDDTDGNFQQSGNTYDYFFNFHTSDRAFVKIACLNGVIKIYVAKDDSEYKLAMRIGEQEYQSHGDMNIWVPEANSTEFNILNVKLYKTPE